MKIWCLSTYPQGIQDVGDFVSSVEHKQRFLIQTVAVCQSYNGSQWDPRFWEKKKTKIRQNQFKACGSQTYKCINATYISNGPLPLLIEIVDSVNGPFER